MMKTTRMYVMLLAAVMTLAACSSSDDGVADDPVVETSTEEETPTGGQEQGEGTSAPVDGSVFRLTERQQQSVPALNTFAVNLFRAMSAQRQDSSTVISSLSAAFVLGMLNEGAEEESRQEITQALGLAGQDHTAVNELFNKFITYAPQVDDGVTVELANNATVNSSIYHFQDTYQQAMEQYYDASIFELDFSQPSALATINDWCNTKTHGLIPSILDRLSESARVCLLNAIYFNAKWTDQFTQKSTGYFYGANSGKDCIEMMKKTANAQYAELQGAKALRLPFGDGHYAMTFILPPASQSLGSYVTTLTADGLEALEFSTEMTDIRIPIYKTAVDTDLIPVLKLLDVKRIFNPLESVLPYMVADQRLPLYVDLMKQKTSIGVDEKGCEGAAVTIAVIRDGAERPGGGQQQQLKTFHATRPFLYYISEVQSGAIFFIGQFCGD